MSDIDLLKSRARDLAKPARTSAASTLDEHVVFRLGTSRFAIALTSVLEVFTPRQVTPLPGWPRGNAGLTAWRGDLLLILDVREFLAVAAAPNTLIDRTIVLRSDTITAGIIVDEIIGIERIEEGARDMVPERLTGIATALTGITGKGVIILDSAALLLHHARGGTK